MSLSYLTRRHFLKTLVVAAGSVAVGSQLSGCDDDDDDNNRITNDPAFFPQSVISGDPKPNSVIVWTRVADAEVNGEIALHLQVATDANFTNKVVDKTDLTAMAAHDHCLKVKVTDLTPGTTYYYRFLYPKGNTQYVTNTGRTKTAPAVDADAEVKFMLLSCQDYIGKYYNTLMHLLETGEELDFVLHVGDYIYETTGDPSFQATGSERTITFSDTEGAIPLGSDEARFYAAASVSNYREIYKAYRTDPILQQIHEKFPFIVIWDDHEYSDDCYGDVGTYFDALQDEKNTARRVNAEQVFYEFMAVDTAELSETDSFTTPNEQLFPNNVLYRDFQFGQHLHLITTDYRSFRPDHIIPEDGFPGTVVMDRNALISVFESQFPGAGESVYVAQSTAFGPYLNIDETPWNSYKPALIGVLTQAYQLAGLGQTAAVNKATADLSGNVSAFIFNQLVEQFNAAVNAGQIPDGQVLPLIDDETYNNLDTGIAYLHLGKQQFFTDFGSRYTVVKPTYDLYASYLYALTLQQGGIPEDAWGATQQTWLYDKIQSARATFLGVASSVSASSLVVDLSAQTNFPPDLQTAFYLNVDHWDGFPNKRLELMNLLRVRGNAFLLSGDIHAAFATDHNGVADFTGTSVSSGTFNSFAATGVEAFRSLLNDEQFADAQEILINQLDTTLQAANSNIRFSDTTRNGYTLMTVSQESVTGTFYLLDDQYVSQSYYDNYAAIANEFVSKTLVFQNNVLSA